VLHSLGYQEYRSMAARRLLAGWHDRRLALLAAPAARRPP
jgi:hypothetical protein